MSLVRYPRFEIVVTNDGSTDDTLALLIEAFGLERVTIPYRPDIDTAPIKGIYRGRGAVDITLIDKANGGRADALNAGLNAARYPYALCTDADVILDPECLMRAMQRVVEARRAYSLGCGARNFPCPGLLAKKQVKRRVWTSARAARTGEPTGWQPCHPGANRGPEFRIAHLPARARQLTP
jgi:glycosyltransferase involved in cell wall biosynthesis